MTGRSVVKEGWGVLWRESSKSLDGPGETILGPYAFTHGVSACVLGGHTVAIFRTRQEARTAIQTNFGYIRSRKDLQGAPHGWLMPVAVRVKATTTIEVST